TGGTRSVAVDLSDSPTSQRRYPDSPCLRPKTRPMVDDQPLLVLPLVHHLVQQRVQRLLPPVAANVAPADDDLGLTTFARRRVVPQPALHPPRDANGNHSQRSAESLIVVRGVPPRELPNKRHVGWIRPLQ